MRLPFPVLGECDWYVAKLLRPKETWGAGAIPGQRLQLLQYDWEDHMVYYDQQVT